VRGYLRHILERVDWGKDLHFQTETTMDTLDYTGHGLHKGSKVVIAAAGDKRRELGAQVPRRFALPDGYDHPRMILPGSRVVEAPAYTGRRDGLQPGSREDRSAEVEQFCAQIDRLHPDLLDRKGIVWIVLVDDSDFCARRLDNFLWVCFLRSNPSHDTYGIQSFCRSKHWGCNQSLVTDARRKPHHAASLDPDPEVESRAAAKVRQE
jgi:4-hydroxy-3-polyprenylbenzoate decarboxylase